MAETRRGNRFVRWLGRIGSSAPLTAEDQESIHHFAINERTRREEVIGLDRGTESTAKDEFMKKGFGGKRVPIFPTREAGLKHAGFAEIPGGGVKIGSGMCGELWLAYKIAEAGVSLESRHLCVVKVQPQSRTVHWHVPAEWQVIWNEVEILRGLVHENIVDYFTHFAVADKVQLQIYILMEYASAGDLKTELERYLNRRIEESGARYYMKQICSGVQHMHSRHVVHNDLHSGNIFLKYNPDGSKTCMIGDFGLSSAFDVSRLRQVGFALMSTEMDVYSVCVLADLMMRGGQVGYPLGEGSPQFRIKLSKEAEEVVSVTLPGGLETPETMRKLREQFKWFRGKAVPPFSQPATLPLQPKQIDTMGFLQPAEPAAGWSLSERAKRQLPSVSGIGSRTREVQAKQRVSQEVTPKTAQPTRSPASLPSTEVAVEAVEQERSPAIGQKIRQRLTSITSRIPRPFRTGSMSVSDGNEDSKPASPRSVSIGSAQSALGYLTRGRSTRAESVNSGSYRSLPSDFSHSLSGQHIEPRTSRVSGGSGSFHSAQSSAHPPLTSTEAGSDPVALPRRRQRSQSLADRMRGIAQRVPNPFRRRRVRADTAPTPAAPHARDSAESRSSGGSVKPTHK